MLQTVISRQTGSSEVLHHWVPSLCLDNYGAGATAPQGKGLFEENHFNFMQEKRCGLWFPLSDTVQQLKRQTDPQCFCLWTQSFGAHLHDWVRAERDAHFVLADGCKPQRCVALQLQRWNQDRLMARVHTETRRCRRESKQESTERKDNNLCPDFQMLLVVVCWEPLPAQAPESKAQAAVRVQTDGDLPGWVELTLQLNGATQGTGGSMRHLEETIWHKKIKDWALQ